MRYRDRVVHSAKSKLDSLEEILCSTEDAPILGLAMVLEHGLTLWRARATTTSY